MVLGATLLLIAPSVMAQRAEASKDACYRWQTQVDASLERIEIDNSKLSDAEVLEGIGCLLNLKGNRKRARFSGYTNIGRNVSSPPPPIKKPATVEVAALYYASYIFYRDWEHAGSVRLYDAETEKHNTKAIVERAYRSYRRWFEKIRGMGLAKAREQKLDPLEDSGVAWS